jgi:hypothetical protein
MIGVALFPRADAAKSSFQQVARLVTEFRNTWPDFPQVRIHQSLQAQVVLIESQVVGETQPAGAFLDSAERTAKAGEGISRPTAWRAWEFKFL